MVGSEDPEAGNLARAEARVDELAGALGMVARHLAQARQELAALGIVLDAVIDASGLSRDGLQEIAEASLGAFATEAPASDLPALVAQILASHPGGSVS